MNIVNRKGVIGPKVHGKQFGLWNDDEGEIGIGEALLGVIVISCAFEGKAVAIGRLVDGGRIKGIAGGVFCGVQEQIGATS